MSSPAEIAQEHHQIYESLYHEMDPRNIGSISAADAAFFLKKSGLPVTVLGQIWELSDRNRTGCLDYLGAFIALKMVAAAQQGIPLSYAVLQAPLMPPTFSLSRSMTPSSQEGRAEIVELPDRSKYEAIFESLIPINGKLSGEKVRPVLLKSGLSPAILGKVWELADIDKDGMLDREEMCLALHLVYRALQNEPVPSVLPSNLIPHSKRRGSHITGGVPVLPPTYIGGGRSRTASLASLDYGSAATTPTHQAAPGGFRSASVQPTSTSSLHSLTGTPSGNVRSPEQQKYEERFREIDTDMDGLVSGSDAMGMMLSSGLSQTKLAEIWALADTKRTGVLNCEQFVYAMMMINTAISGGSSITSIGHHQITSTGGSRPTGNKEIDAMQIEIDRLNDERRAADAAVVQLEADMTVKQSEIKNLQVELNTLESTVKQLERQKIEANKRLGELDNQKEAMRDSLRLLEANVEAEQERCLAIRAENQKSVENAKEEEDGLRVQRAALAALQDEQRHLESRLRAGNREMEAAVADFTQLEREVDKGKDAERAMTAENEKMTKILSRLESLLVAQDVDTLRAEQGELLANFASPSTAMPVASNMASYYDRVPEAVDPFASHNPIVDPFASSDAFGASTAFDDPFSGSDPFSSSKANAGGKAPPRPAPPKNRAATPSDPFAGQTSAGEGSGFADFSRAFS